MRGTSTVGTADTDGKRPGWPDDQPSSETFQNAQDILDQLEVPVDYSEMLFLGSSGSVPSLPL